MKIAVVGATGLVGSEMLKILMEQGFQDHTIIPCASENSVGKEIYFGDKPIKVQSVADTLAAKPEFALFSAGGEISKRLAPQFVENGTCVIDNSSAWRMDPNVPLIVPEINADQIKGARLIANPNCSTIQLVMALNPLHQIWGLRRIILSTYQSVTGSGKKAVDQLLGERMGESPEKFYPWAIDLNCIPHCDVFLENGYTREEMKLVNESRKILSIPELQVSATAVRVPVVGGHSISVNAEFQNSISAADARIQLTQSPGLKVWDTPALNQYPMPILSQNNDWVWVGRIRADESQVNTLNLWITADNLRKGAATNAVQILQYCLTEYGTA